MACLINFFFLKNHYNRNTILDIQDIKISNWDEKLKEFVRNSHYFVLLLAEGSFDGINKEDDEEDRFFDVEIRTAIESQRFILPIFEDKFSWDSIPEDYRDFIKRRNGLPVVFRVDEHLDLPNKINSWTLEFQPDVEELTPDAEKLTELLLELEDSNYKGLVEDYFEDVFCEICDPKNPFANYIVWSSYDRKIDEGEELIEKIGYCNFCNSTAIVCNRCGSLTNLDDDRNECEGGCGIEFAESSNRDGGLDINAVEINID